MERDEHFPSTEIRAIRAHLSWASLEMYTAEIEEVLVLISGSDTEIAAVHIA